jgi:CHAD domain-containing protein
MSVELGRNERLGEGVLRVAAEEVGAAGAALRGRRRSGDDDPVHEARKHIRRARSLLRLAAGVVPDKLRKREGARLRDAARTLSAARDRKVILGLVTRLATEGKVPERYLRYVADELRRAHPPRAEERKCLTAVARQLSEAQSELATGESQGDGFSVRGLRRTYSAGRQAMRSAAREGEPSSFHEWRKRAKDLRHQLEFLSPIWPGVLPALADDLHGLTDLLGQANDMELLVQKLETMPPTDPDELLGGPVAQKLAEWKCELRGEALRAGARLYSDKPRIMLARMEACWDATRGG